jgi:large subunit ribosomal protein L1
VKFVENVDVAINLGVDPRKSDQVVRGATTLPHGTGKQVRVAVFTQGENAEARRRPPVPTSSAWTTSRAGQEGRDELRRRHRLAGRHARRRPTRSDPRAARTHAEPEDGTVTPDVETAVKNAKAGQVRYRTDRNGIIHGSIGRVGFDPVKVKENLEALLGDLKKAKPASVEGRVSEEDHALDDHGPRHLHRPVVLEL